MTGLRRGMPGCPNCGATRSDARGQVWMGPPNQRRRTRSQYIRNPDWYARDAAWKALLAAHGGWGADRTQGEQGAFRDARRALDGRYPNRACYDGGTPAGPNLSPDWNLEHWARGPYDRTCVHPWHDETPDVPAGWPPMRPEVVERAAVGKRRRRAAQGKEHR